MSVEVDAPGTGASAIGGRALQAARHRLASSSLLRHNVLLFAASMVTSVFSYLYHPVVGHLLGPSGYGTLGSLGALGAILLIPGQMVVYIANKFAADLTAQGHMAQVNYLLRRATRYALLVGLLLAITFISLSSVFARFLHLPSTQLVVVMGLGLVLAFAAPLNVGVVQGRQQFKWFAFLNVCVALLRVISTTVVLLLGFGMTGVLLASLMNGAVIYALSFVPLRDVLWAPQARIPSFKPLLTYSFGAVLTIGGSTLLLNTDTILAKHFLSSTDAGYYAALTKMGQSVLFVGGSMVLVMFPKVAALQQQGRPHRGVLAWTMAGVFALSACVLFFFWLFPSQIITLIFHAPAVVSRQLFWYGLAMLLLALANVLMYYFLSLGQMAFVPILLICCGLQATLIMVWHGSIAQIVAVMVAVMATLLCGVAALCAIQLARDSRRGVCEQPV